MSEKQNEKNSYKFFANHDCRYYPCHETDGEINCLFCYCPMYFLPACPGSYEIIEAGGKKIKSCMNCDYPHRAEHYDAIMEYLKEQM